MLLSLDVWPGYLFLYVPFAYTHAASHLMMYNGGGRFLELLFYLWFGLLDRRFPGAMAAQVAKKVFINQTVVVLPVK